jgi:hypothetical protein
MSEAPIYSVQDFSPGFHFQQPEILWFTEVFGVDDKVNRLRKSLTQELSLRNALNRGFHRALGSLPRIPNNLPVQVRFSDSML